jgi:ABC-2 type transport system permease protein
MNHLPFVLLAAVLALVVNRLRRRRGRGLAGRLPAWRPRAGWPERPVGLVAAREVRERTRGKVFRAGTVLILLGVGAAIVVPVVARGKAHIRQVGIVGALSAPARQAVLAAAASAGTGVRLVPEGGVTEARDGLRSGHLDLAVVGGRSLLVDKQVGSDDTTGTAALARSVARTLGALNALTAAGLSATQAAEIARSAPLPVASVRPGAASHTGRATSVTGLVLVVIMLTQYNTWTLIGVMEEKSSRVAEVLLSAVRPAQLLAGKVLGIGLVAFAQAAAVVGFAAALASAVGSGLLHGTAPAALTATLVWLVLGYAFYCWVFAAAGSLAERRDQIQSLTLPLSLPIFFGYIFSVTAASSGNASTLLRVLAYLPLTAPFAMPVLVGLGAVSWWQFAASATISILCTLGVARLAIGIYRKAILRTGRRVRLREILTGAGAA